MTPYTAHFRRLLALAWPVASSQLAAQLLWVVDLMMLGRVGVEALDAAALGRMVIWGTFAMGFGLLLGLDPIASQAHGAEDRRGLAAARQRGIVLALWASLPIGLLWLQTGRILELLGQPAPLVGPAAQYVLVQLPALPLFLVYFAMRQVLQAQGVVRPDLVVTLLANLVNAFFNWLLIFGHCGFPALGLVGAGVATAVTQAFMLLALWTWTRRDPVQRRLVLPWRRSSWAFGPLLRIVHFGWPVAAQVSFEVWAFGIGTLLAGWLGEIPLASHSLTLTLASVSFMLPFGISMAAMARVGNLIGAGQPQEAQRAAWASLALGGGVMAVSGLLFLFARVPLARLFSHDPAVVALAASVLPIAAAFQVFDGLQVVGAAILRAMGRTRPAALFNFIGYYCLALPLAWWLAFRAGLGLAGIWWGLALALALVAFALVLWVVRQGPATLPGHAA